MIYLLKVFAKTKQNNELGTSLCIEFMLHVIPCLIHTQVNVVPLLFLKTNSAENQAAQPTMLPAAWNDTQHTVQKFWGILQNSF